MVTEISKTICIHEKTHESMWQAVLTRESKALIKDG